MPEAPKIVEDKLNKTISAWARLRPTKSFGKMTLEEFRTKVKASFDERKIIEGLETDLTAAIDRRSKADVTSNDTLQLVVNGVVGDPDEGDDGELYEAMGYVRKSARKSGLTRGKKTPPPAK